MEGSNVYRATLIGTEFLKSPVDGGRWIVDKLRRRSPLLQRLPWMTYGAIEYLRTRIYPGARVFEWGAGGSTVFFLDLGASVTTVESDAMWLNDCRSQLSPVIGDRSWTPILIGSNADDRAATQRYVGEVKSHTEWDVVVVDGLEEEYVSRVECVINAKDTIAKNGILVLDDAYREKYLSIPKILSNWTRLIFRGFGPARIGVSQTDIYLRNYL